MKYGSSMTDINTSIRFRSSLRSTDLVTCSCGNMYDTVVQKTINSIDREWEVLKEQRYQVSEYHV